MDNSGEDEMQRLAAVSRYRRLLEDDDAFCVQAVRTARAQFAAPAAYVSLFEKGRERLIARRGIMMKDLPAQGRLFGADTVSEDLVVIEDLGNHPQGPDLALRFALPEAEFFAAAPLVAAGVGAVGCIGILDLRARRFGDAERDALQALAALVLAGLESRRERTPAPAPADPRLPDPLRTETYLLHTLMDHLPDNIYFKDIQSRFVRINRSMAHYLGLNHPQEAIGKSDFDVFAEAHARPAYEDEQEIIRTGDAMVDKEEKETWPDGHVTWVSTTKLPLRDAQGGIIGTFGLSRDVTDRKSAQEAMMRHAVELEAANAQHRAELALASELQRAFLPERYPVFPPHADPHESLLQFCHVYSPAEVVGGDFFSVVPLSRTSAGLLVCDVVGHGVRAALVTSMMNAVIHDLGEYASDPAVFLHLVNERLWASLGGRFGYGFVTAFYLVVYPSEHTIRFAGAGHPSPLLLRRNDGRVEPLAGRPHMTGQALLLQPHPEYTTHEAVLSPGDAIMMYTDGIYEVRGEERETYGIERLQALMTQYIDEPLPALFQRILSETLAFSSNGEFQDDVCMLGVELAERTQRVRAAAT